MRLVLHAGTHKTGTTSIQSSLAENRDWLRERGYVYPSLGRVGHNEFAYRLSRVKPDGVETLHAELMSVADPGRVLVLSAEEFSTHLAGAKQWRFDKHDYWDLRRDYLKRLQTVLRDFDEIGVFLCFRRHDNFAQSLYATNILSNQYRWSFAEFRERCAPLFDYRRQVHEFRAGFTDIRLASFERLKHDLVPAFCAWTGLPVPPKPLAEAKKVSPDTRLVYWLYRRGSEAAGAEAEASVDTFKLMASFARSKAAAVLPDTPSSLWRSEQEWCDFIAGCTDPEPGFFPPYASPPPLNEMSQEELGLIDRAFAEWTSKPRKEKTWRRAADNTRSLAPNAR